MQQVEDEYIDRTHWLPLNSEGKVEVLTEAREARGDTQTITSDGGWKQIRALNEPLLYYLHTDVISPRQFDAGDRLYRAWRRSFAARVKTMRFGPPAPGSELEVSCRLAREYLTAIGSIRAERERRVVYSVCCYGEFVKNLVASSQRTAQRYGIPLLRSGLDDLVKHYGL